VSHAGHFKGQNVAGDLGDQFAWAMGIAHDAAEGRNGREDDIGPVVAALSGTFRTHGHDLALMERNLRSHHKK
jgi:hypothetical protein